MGARVGAGSESPAMPRSFNKLRLGLVRPLYAVMIASNLQPIFAEEQPGPVPWIRPLGLGLLVGGVAWRLWALGVLHKRRTLACTGPYAHTRNPLYLGTLAIGLGLGLSASWPWSLPLVCVYAAAFRWLYANQIRWEEHRLAAIFGDAYRTYRANVPRFWPRATAWRAPEGAGGFSLRALLRNHAVALLAGSALLLFLVDFTSGVAWPVLRGDVAPRAALTTHYGDLRLFRGAP